jgi:hypothetical protein
LAALAKVRCASYLGHANRRLIFNYKIASVCGILGADRKQPAIPIHDYARSSYPFGTLDIRRTARGG